MIEAVTFDYVTWQWAIAVVIALFFFSKTLFKKFPWWLALALSYTILQTFIFGAYVDLFKPYSREVNSALMIRHSEVLALLFLCTWLLSWIKPKKVWLGYLCATNIIVTLVLYPFHLETKGWTVGLAVNPSMNGAITAITMPFIFSLPGYHIVLFTLGLVCIFLSDSTTPVFAGLAALIGPGFINSNKKARNGCLIIALVLAAIKFIPNFSNATDRVEKWQFFGRKFLEMFNPVIGAGNGSFAIWGPVLGGTNEEAAWFTRFFARLGVTGYNRKIFLWEWLHSDIYQTLFELGIIGLVLWTICIVFTLRKFRRDEALLGASFGWIVTASLYYPLHFPIHLSIGIILLSFAIKKENC